MARINPLTIEQAEPNTAKALQGVQKSLGVLPNLIATLAVSPASLNAYLGLGQALGTSSLSGALREQLALAVAGANSCEYCASAHTVLGGGQGVDSDELARNLNAESSDPKVQAALDFARSIAVKRGFVSDGDFNAVREAGYTDAQIVDIITVVALNTFTNYFNHIIQTENDFPKVEVPEPATA